MVALWDNAVLTYLQWDNSRHPTGHIMEKTPRINVRADQPLKDELKEVSDRTGLIEAVIVREAVKEKLRSLKNTHPAYTSQIATAEPMAA